MLFLPCGYDLFWGHAACCLATGFACLGPPFHSLPVVLTQILCSMSWVFFFFFFSDSYFPRVWAQLLHISRAAPSVSCSPRFSGKHDFLCVCVTRWRIASSHDPLTPDDILSQPNHQSVFALWGSLHAQVSDWLVNLAGFFLSFSNNSNCEGVNKKKLVHLAYVLET